MGNETRQLLVAKFVDLADFLTRVLDDPTDQNAGFIAKRPTREDGWDC